MNNLTTSGISLTRTTAWPQQSGQNLAAQATTSADTPDSELPEISQAARDALAVEARLADIKAKGPVNRSPEDQDFLVTNDQRLASILAKSNKGGQLMADEVDYMQKASGFVNTFANLNTEEKALYDEAVASGNKAAAAAISRIALNRMGDMAGGANGTTYDPKAMQITPANIEQYFRHSFVDPTGRTQADFQALIQFLQNRPENL